MLSRTTVAFGAWMLIALGLCACASRARALDVSFSAPAQCGSREELLTLVSTVAGSLGGDMLATVAITPDDEEGYTLEVTVPDQTRRISDVDCRVLFESAALMIALSINPGLASGGDTSLPGAPLKSPGAARGEAEAPRMDAAGAPISGAAAPSAPVTRTPMRKALRSGLWLESGVVHGVVPAWAFSVGVGVQLGGAWLSAAGSLHYVPPREDRESDRVSVQAASARLLLLVTPPMLLWFGAGLQGDLLFGRGRNLEIATHDTIARGAACAELGLVLFHRGRHRLALVTDLSLALHQARFRVRRDDAQPRYRTVYRPEPWAIAGLLRWQVHFRR